MQDDHDLAVSLGTVDLILDESLDVGVDVTDIWCCVAEGSLDYGFDDVEDNAAGFVVDAVDWAAEGLGEEVEIALHPLGDGISKVGGWVSECMNQ